MAFLSLWAPALLIYVTHGHLRVSSTNATSSIANATSSIADRNAASSIVARNATSSIAAHNATSSIANATSSIAARNASSEKVTPVLPSVSGPRDTKQVHLLSFRSCSQRMKANCNKESHNARRSLFEQLMDLSAKAAKIPIISRHHLFETLPDEIFEDPKWSAYVMEDKHNGSLTPGRGYWFWKAAIFNYLVRNGELRLGDIAIWMDPDHWEKAAGGLGNDGWASRLSCTTAISKGGFDLFAESIRYCENRYTKGDIFHLFNTTPYDSYYGMTQQFQAGFWIASVNERTLKFMEVWEDLLSNVHLISDEKSVFPNYKRFQENRHDQSLFSMLTKAQGPAIRDYGWSVVHCAANNTKSDVSKHRKHPVYGIDHFEASVVERYYFRDAGKPEVKPFVPFPEWRSSYVCEPWPTTIRTVAATKPQRYIYFQGKRLDVDVIEEARSIGK